MSTNRGYPDGYLAEYYDARTGEPKSGSGDTLAEFIVKELKDTFDGEADEVTQVIVAVQALECAMAELEDTIAALENGSPNRSSTDDRL